MLYAIGRSLKNRKWRSKLIREAQGWDILYIYIFYQSYKGLTVNAVRTERTSSFYSVSEKKQGNG